MNALIHLGCKAARLVCESDAVKDFLTETLPDALGSVASAVGEMFS